MLCCHGGDQRLVAPVENSEDMLNIDLELTGNEGPWDPTILDKESDEQDERNQFKDYILQIQMATKFFIQTLCMITCGNTIYQACANVMEKATSASTAIKEHDHEKLRTLLGWLPLEAVKKTLGHTTQFAMSFLIHLPFEQHHKSSTPQLNVPRLAETFAMDTSFSSEPSLSGVTCAQLFVGTSSKLTK
eukprot:11436143-Ditylum_brightwellii.AAC.1